MREAQLAARPGGALCGVLTLGALALAAWLLWVPIPRVVLANDMLGYAAQGRSLLQGDGNAVRLDQVLVPGYYPAGLPALIALALALLGPDMRHAQVVVWLAALLLLVLAAALARRAAGAWAGPVAVLLVLASTQWRGAATAILSQVPTAAVVLAATLLLTGRATRARAFGAGLLASGSLLLRFANLGFPVAVVLAAPLLARGRELPARRWLGALAAGLATGGALLALHNAWAWGSPLATGYAAFGHDTAGQFALSNIVDPWSEGLHDFGPVILRSLAGLGELYPVPVAVASVWGLVVLLRAGGEPRRIALLAALFVAAQDLILAAYPFRSELYLVPAFPLQAVVAAAGLLDAAGRAWRRGGPLLAAAAAAGLLAFDLARPPAPVAPTLEEAIARHDLLERAGRELGPDFALLTPADFGLVEPLVRAPGRRILYVVPHVSPLIAQAVSRELDGAPCTPAAAVAWAQARLAEGRDVYVDGLPPPRVLREEHKQLKQALLERCTFEPTDLPGLFRLRARG
jgi:hypothetical protein